MEQKDVIVTKTEREVITENLLSIIGTVDDKTLREIERLVIGWLGMKRKIRERQAEATEDC